MVAQAASGDAGNGRYAAGLAAALRATARGDDHVAALVATDGGRVELAPLVDRLIDVPANDLYRLGFAAPRALAGADIDVAVFAYIAPPRPRCRLALIIHDATFITHPQWLPPRARGLLRSLVPRSAARADSILAPSWRAREDIVTALGIAPERIHVATNYPSPIFTPDPDGTAAARVHARFGLGRYCLAVGDLGPRKNLVALGEAMRLLGDRDLTLALVGKPGPGGERIARESGGRWLGYVSDGELADLYRAAAVTACPSLYEGFGLPVVEAMACGSPVVTSNRGALSEVAGEGGLWVERIPPGLAEDVRAALEPAVADRLRAAGPARAAAYNADEVGESGWRAARGGPAPAGPPAGGSA